MALPAIRPDTAGIDIGSMKMFAAVSPDRAEECVRSFGSFTSDLQELIQWLQECGVKSVAMESTGVYWVPLYQLLADAGMEVCLVNARHFKNVPGRKTDVQEIIVSLDSKVGQGDDRRRERQEARLRKQAMELGFTLVAAQTSAA